MGKYFGTDGFRGEANVDLTADHAYQVGRFLGWYFTQLRHRSGAGGRAGIVIGKDTRRSGYMLEYALVSGLVASGADAYLLHVTTTPSVAYVVRTDGFDCGVMISASHNPYQDNGLKLIGSSGEKMDEGVTALVEDWLDGRLNAFGKCWDALPLATGEQIGRTVDYVSGRDRYVGYLIGLGIYSFKGLRVGLDCANGSAWTIAKAVFDALGARTYVIGADPDGFNINEDCGSTHMAALQKLVTEKGLDVGFAFDGDADRCLCVDEKGNIVTGDHILYLCGKHMKEKGRLPGNTVVTTVMSNLGLCKAFDDLGISYARTAVGDRYVYDHMMSHGCSLGGEQSGHIIFSKHASTGDGILTSLKVMEVMLAEGKPLSGLCEGFTVYPQVLRNISVSSREEAMDDPDVRAAIEEAARELGEKGRILVRPSGTEPLIRIMAEAESEAICANIVDRIAAVISAKGHES